MRLENTNLGIANGGYDRSKSVRGWLRETGMQPYLDDAANTEIAINRPFELWTESSKGWQKHDLPLLDYHALQNIANVFAIYNKLELNKDNPICSGVLPDGQRGQIVIPSACERDTVSISIRRASSTRFALHDYIQSGRLDRWSDVSTFQPDCTVAADHQLAKFKAEAQEIARLNQLLNIPDDVHLQLFELQMLQAKANRDIDTFIRLGVQHKQNFCLVGATGSGKTTFTKSICDLVPLETRIITIEDTAELDLPLHLNRVHLFYKDVTPKALLRSCMRMKPDRIFLTELRGDEAYDYLNLLNTGHGGSVTTVHANDCYSAYYRVANLIKQSEIGRTMDFERIIADVYTTLDVMMFLDHTYVTELSFDPVRKYRLLKGKAL